MNIQMQHDQRNEQGFILVTALLVMLVLTIIGIAATTNTSIELLIAGNDKVHKKTFYDADAGSVLGSELLEQSFNCLSGFSATPLPGTQIHTRDLVLWSKSLDDLTDHLLEKLNDPVNKYDVAYPYTGGALASQEVGYLYFGGETNVLPGGALEMAAGYEGKGKSAAQGGVAKIFNVYSQFKGLTNSESIILLGWRHLVGSEGSCAY